MLKSKQLSVTAFFTSHKRKHDSISSFDEQRPPKRRKRVKTKKQLTQIFIDAGQKDLKVNKCPLCGMEYTVGLEQDEKVHSKYCKQRSVISFPGWKKENVLEELDDGERIIVIEPTDQKYCLKKANEIKQFVDKELGFAESKNSCKDVKVSCLIFTL